MAKFLTTSGITHHIEEIIIEAKSELVLVSPYLQISNRLYERLKDTNSKNVKILIVFGKDELKPNEMTSLAELKNVELFFYKDLHAKCYYNETEMVITSMNMYEFSEKNNREMGVLINRNTDKDLFENAKKEAQSILKFSEKHKLVRTYEESPKHVKGNGKYFKKKSVQIENDGYCVRCKTQIPHKLNKPFCNDCYSSWSQYGNTDYGEKFCHSCGEKEPTSMNKPQCFTCYSEQDSLF